MNSSEKDISRVIFSIRVKSMSFFVAAALLILLTLIITRENMILSFGISIALLAYAAYENHEITKKIKDGKYKFVYATCVSASESTGLANKLPSVVRGVVQPTKNKDLDYIFSAQDAEDKENTVEIGIRAGSDRREFYVGMLYLLCFDEREDGSYNSDNLIGYTKASQELVSLDASDFSVQDNTSEVADKEQQDQKADDFKKKQKKPVAIIFPSNSNDQK